MVNDMETPTEALLRGSIEIEKLKNLIRVLTVENATLRQRLHERAAFDLAADGLPLSRPQAG